MSDALILFVRKPELGKVKTRIAQTEGNDFALSVYKKLLQHTYAVTAPLPCAKYVFYAGAVVENDMWSTGYHKSLQAETDLGNRMKAAFETVLNKGHQRVCIIGSDCYELTTPMIQQAFEQLSKHDIVIGPAHDGGYYLLGMKESLKDVFQNIDWSTDKVLQQTIAQTKTKGYSFTLLSTLNDVDTIEDVPMHWRQKFMNNQDDIS